MSGYNPRKRPAPVEPNDKSDVKVIKSEFKMDGCKHINTLPDAYLAQIFEKLGRKERLKIEQVCKKWQYVGKNLSWSNHRVFKNARYCNWPEERVMQIKPFFERCGRYLRHLRLYNWSPQVVLSFIRMAPNVQHLNISETTLNDECLKELVQIVPRLKSLALETHHGCYKSLSNCEVGLMECFKTMTRLEYLSIHNSDFYNKCVLFNLYSFVHFPPSLRYLALDGIKNSAEILTWVATECHNLKGLNLRLFCDVNEKTLQAISQLKNLTYLKVWDKMDICDIGYVFKALTKLRSLNMNHLDEKHIKMKAAGGGASLEPDVVLEMLRCCKNMQSIGLDFGRINLDFYSNICQMVDEIDEKERKNREFRAKTHTILQVQCNSGLPQKISHEYKWLQFTVPIWSGGGAWKMSSEKWQYGCLSAGKPDWEY